MSAKEDYWSVYEDFPSSCTARRGVTSATNRQARLLLINLLGNTLRSQQTREPTDCLGYRRMIRSQRPKYSRGHNPSEDKVHIFIIFGTKYAYRRYGDTQLRLHFTATHQLQLFSKEGPNQ